MPRPPVRSCGPRSRARRTSCSSIYASRATARVGAASRGSPASATGLWTRAPSRALGGQQDDGRRDGGRPADREGARIFSPARRPRSGMSPRGRGTAEHPGSRRHRAGAVTSRPEWLARRIEAALDPDLPIIDSHHHLWDRPDEHYLLDEFLADTGTGHRIVGSVFVQCRAMYRAAGPIAMRPVGETEFVNGVAAMSASGTYGPARLCARHRRPCRPPGRRGCRAGAGRAYPGRRRTVPRHPPDIGLGRGPGGDASGERGRPAYSPIPPSGPVSGSWPPGTYRSTPRDLIKLTIVITCRDCAG